MTSPARATSRRPRPVTAVSTWFHDPSFRTPERVPWSELSADFIAAWSPPEGNKREHWEITGPSGSGKSRLLLTAMQDHYRTHEEYRRANKRKHLGTGGIYVVTKRDDEVFSDMGWPVETNGANIRDSNLIFWPQTSLTGSRRKEFHRSRIQPLLEDLWAPDANVVLGFDEVGYVESLAAELRELLQMYWREARSVGIQVVGMKQRPQGALRDMHSETFWTSVFKPKDRADADRFAELLGHRRDWLPVLDSLSLDKHEFVHRHSRSGESYISWIDSPLRPQKIRRPGPRWY